MIRFENSAASTLTLSWVVDRDCTIVSGMSIAASAVFSYDPSLTYAIATTPTASQVTDNFVLLIPGNFQPVDLAFPLSKNQKVYCAMTAAKGTSQLWVEDVAS